MIRGIPHKWTQDQLEIIRRDYQGTVQSQRALALKLGVSRWQVHYALEGMGLNFRWNERYWTAKEDEYLMSHYESMTEKQMSKALKRSRNSIHVRCTRLKLNRRNRDGWYTMKEVCEILGVDHHKVTLWINSEVLKASWHHGHKPQKNGSGYWHIERDDLRHFIRKYPQELIGRNLDVIQFVDILSGISTV